MFVRLGNGRVLCCDKNPFFSKANFCSVYFNNLRGNFFYEILGVVSNTGVLFSSNNFIEELIVLRNVQEVSFWETFSDFSDLFWSPMLNFARS